MSDNPVNPDGGGSEGGGGEGGAAGIYILGQPDEFSNVENALGMLPTAVAMTADGKLVVGDYLHFRGLVYDTIPSASLAKADHVVGQTSIQWTVDNGTGATASNLYHAYYCEGFSTGANKLLLADTSNSRALMWNVIPTSDGRSADMVLGQMNFTTRLDPDSSPNAPAPTASSLNGPCGMATDGARVAIADTANNRVLVWNTTPMQPGKAADIVLGQKDFVSRTKTCPVNDDAKCLADVSSVWFEGTQLWVADYGRNRVLAWNNPTTTYQAADLVIGQPDFVSNNTSPSKASLLGPRKATTAGGKLFVADQVNNRVLVWNTKPTMNGQAADVVIGQPDGASVMPMHGAMSPDAKSLNGPISVSSNGTKLAVADSNSQRVLVWNTIPTADFAAADVVLGRPSMTATFVRPPTPIAYSPGSAHWTGKRFLAAEYSRILIWNHMPAGPTDGAELALGQSDLQTTNDLKPDAVHFRAILAVWGDDARTVAADTYTGRVLVWTKPITANGQPADLVLGQKDFVSTGNNEMTMMATASRLANPSAITSDGTHLAIADTGNSRILIWNSFPTSSGQPADVVLGQADMTSRDRNRGGIPTAGTLARPMGVHFDGKRLWVGDADNNRVLAWDGWPTTNGQSATLVLGQPDFAAGSVNNGGRSAKSMASPRGIFVDGNRLYVNDTLNHRLLWWNAIPTENDKAADGFHGQVDLSVAEVNHSGLNAKSLHTPIGLTGSADRVFIVDSGNGRVVALPKP